MIITHRDILIETLARAELYDSTEDVLEREGTVFAGNRFSKLDLSNLGPVEIPDIIYLLKGIKVLDLRNNQIEELLLKFWSWKTPKFC